MQDLWKSPETARRFLEGRARAIPFAREMGEILLRLLAGNGGVDSFADVGCGGGRIGRLVLDVYPNASAVFADLNETMLEAARKDIGEQNGQVRFLQADFHRTEWADELVATGPFDAVVSGFAIHHLPDDRKQAVYEDIFRMLRPGGIFVHLEHVASASEWGERMHDEFFIDTAYAAGVWEDKTRQEALAEYAARPDREANVLTPVGTQLSWLWEIGFTDVDCFFKAFELSVFGGRKPAG
ncbi:MAG: class I SAM-dependent methyltransferase [Phycisphaerae bacterium]